MDYITTGTSSLTNTNSNSFKELWKRPGSGFAKVTGIGAIAAGGFAFCKYALPFMVAAASNLIVLAGELIVLFAIAYVFMSKDFRRGLSLIWLQIMRKFYGLIVVIDPIAILENGIKEMQKQGNDVNEQCKQLDGLKEDMKKKLDTYKRTFENNIEKEKILKKRIDSAKNQNDKLQAQSDLKLCYNEITRGQQLIDAQTKRINQTEFYLENIMNPLRIAVNFKIKDSKNELSYIKDEYEQAKVQQKAISSITSILNGGLTKSMEEELAMDHISTTINNSIAEINELVDGSNDILKNFNLETEINAGKAEKIIEMFNKNGYSIFNSIENTSDSSYELPEGEKEPVMVNINQEHRYF